MGDVQVILSLPGFNRTGATGRASSSAVRVYTNSSQGTYFNATWLRSDSQLVFQAQTSIAAGAAPNHRHMPPYTQLCMVGRVLTSARL